MRKQTILSIVRRQLVAVFIIVTASVIREVLFSSLGRGIPYLTYYPAVALAALFGGLSTGVLATGLSGLLTFFWIQQGYMSNIETLAMGVFLLTCILISWIAGGMRSTTAKLQAEVNDRRQAEEKLKASEFRFRLAAESLTDVIYEWDIKEKIDWYGEIDELMSYAPGAFPRTLTGWVALLHPDDKEHVQWAIDSQLKGEASYNIEYRVENKKGEWRWWSARGIVLRDLQGTPYHWIGSITDITERKHAIAALQEGETKFRNIFEHSPLGKSLTGLDGTLSVNQAFCDIVGYSEEELKAKNWKEITHPDDVQESMEIVASLLEGKTSSVHFEKRYIHKNGAIVWTDVTTALEKDESGTPLYFLTTISNITGRKQMEEELQLANADNLRLLKESQFNERRFRALLDHSSDAITVIDADNNILYQSSSVEAVEGYLPEELAGANGLTDTHPDDLALVQATVRQLLANPGQPIPCTWRRRHKDGRWIWLEGVATNLLDDPAVRGIVTNYRDITPRKQAEEALRLENERFMRFVNSNIVGIVIAEANGRIALANDYYLNILGVSRQDFLDEKVDWRKFTPPDWLPADENALRELSERGICEPYEKEYVRGDGRRVPVYIADAILPGPEEQIAAFVIDITERKQAEQKIIKLTAELEQRVAQRTAQLEITNKELQAFAYSVSHDLRAPLRGIDGFSQALLKKFSGQLGQEGEHYLTRVRENTKRMGQLIDDLLILSRISRQEMSHQSLDLMMLATEIAAELAESEPQRKVRLQIAGQAMVEGDAGLLKVVLQNLIGNAWKFTSTCEAAEIEVGFKNSGDERVFFVRDNGVGFDMQYADKLFGAFQRLHSTQEFPGTGIGLATVQRVIHRHGGRICAESAVDKGATFYFTLGETS